MQQNLLHEKPENIILYHQTTTSSVFGIKMLPGRSMKYSILVMKICLIYLKVLLCLLIIHFTIISALYLNYETNVKIAFLYLDKTPVIAAQQKWGHGQRCLIDTLTALLTN